MVPEDARRSEDPVQLSERLRESEERYRSLIEHLPVVVYVNRAEGKGVEYVTPNVEQMLGYPVRAYLDDPYLWGRTLHDEDRERVIPLWQAAWKEGVPYEAEYRFVKPDGSIVWVRDTAYALRDPDGDPVWHGVMLDVTAERVAHERREALEVVENRYRKLVEQLPATVYVIANEEDPDVLYVTPNITELSGWAAAAWLDGEVRWADTIHPEDREASWARWMGAFESGTPFTAEFRMVRSDGRVIWVRDSCVPIRDAEGSISLWQGVIMDVSEEKRIRGELSTSEARHRTLVEQLPAVVYEMGVDDERRTYYVSPHVEHVLGYSREEWLEQSDIWIELLHPDDRERELDAHDRHIASGEPWDREYRLIASDGREVWVRDRASLLRGPGGEPTAWLGVMLDITRQKQLEAELREANRDLELRVLTRTAQLEEANELMALEIAERRRAEKELSRAEERFRHLLENVPAVVYRWQPRPSDDGHEYWYTSPQIEQVLGYSPEEWHEGWGRWRERVHPHDRDRVNELSLRSEETGEPFELEYRLFAKDGRIVWVFDRATLMTRNAAGEPLVFQGVMLDITAKKEAERRATEAEERFRAITESGPVITYAFRLEPTDPPTVKVEYVSPQIGTILGYPLSRWVNDPDVWLEMTHPDDRWILTRIAETSWVSGEPWDVVYRMIASDGHLVWLNDRGLCTDRDENGRPHRFLGGILDVTERAEELETLRKHSMALTDLVEGIPAITWTESVDAEGRSRFLYISPQSLAFFGYSAEELMAEPLHFERMLHEDDHERVLAPVPPGQREWDQIYRVRHRDGSIRWLHGRAQRVTPDGTWPAIWQGFTVDLTERMKGEPREARDLYGTPEPSV